MKIIITGFLFPSIIRTLEADQKMQAYLPLPNEYDELGFYYNSNNVSSKP